MTLNYILIFFISLFTISLELFLTQILNLKTWNHVVYIIISFSMLGYGIGANTYLLLKERLAKFDKNSFLGVSLLALSVLSVAATLILANFPIQVEYIIFVMSQFNALFMLLVSYCIILIPFIIIGFIVVLVFSASPARSHKLYFFDLIGAAAGAYLFFPLINTLAVFRSVLLLALSIFCLSLPLLFPSRKRSAAFGGIIFALLCLNAAPQDIHYKIDQSKIGEGRPDFVPEKDIKYLHSVWHPLGQTNVHVILDEAARQKVYDAGKGPLEINVEPLPEYSYISTNYLGGAPIYKLSREGLAEHRSHVKLFSQGFEVPYLLFKEPAVFIIGTGGGRDIFMAKTHNAKKIIGAEINPAIYRMLSPGGKFYNYSGEVYAGAHTRVFNLDGRHLAKKLPPASFDLIILNGVDTFSGLSNGAYAYAESYLYTKDALMDYLRLLNDQGVINFNRWLFRRKPRESLRLMGICLDALRASGAARAWEHVIIGEHERWSLMLIKKTPFSDSERAMIQRYFLAHNTALIYPSERLRKFNKPANSFDQYAYAFSRNEEKPFIKNYPYDISVVTDNNPFFFKYYKLKDFNPFFVQAVHHTGTIIFMTQFMVLMQALLFIVLFIFFPLSLLKKSGITTLPPPAIAPFIVYFSCLGTGFMFIEISLMQKFTLLLGSPIHSISVTLATLLLSSGIGSALAPGFQKAIRHDRLLVVLGMILSGMLFFLTFAGSGITNALMGLPFAGRTFCVMLLLFPVGICLGCFFPSGLALVGKGYNESIAWAWGLNSGFSVLGSILSVILAQFYGFNFIITLAVCIYWTAVISFIRMVKTINPTSVNVLS